MNLSRFRPPTSPEAPSGSRGPAGRSEGKVRLLPSAERSFTSVVASHPRRFHRVPEPKPLPPLRGVTAGLRTPGASGAGCALPLPEVTRPLHFPPASQLPPPLHCYFPPSPLFRFRRSRLLSVAAQLGPCGGEGGREGGGVEELGFSGALAAAPLPGEC